MNKRAKILKNVILILIISVILTIVVKNSVYSSSFVFNVNATKTAEVANLDSLESAMNDNETDVVKLTSDITLRSDFDTTFTLTMSKTLDFNGKTLTVP